MSLTTPVNTDESAASDTKPPAAPLETGQIVDSSPMGDCNGLIVHRCQKRARKRDRDECNSLIVRSFFAAILCARGSKPCWRTINDAAGVDSITQHERETATESVSAPKLRTILGNSPMGRRGGFDSSPTGSEAIGAGAEPPDGHRRGPVARLWDTDGSIGELST